MTSKQKRRAQSQRRKPAPARPASQVKHTATAMPNGVVRVGVAADRPPLPTEARDHRPLSERLAAARIDILISFALALVALLFYLWRIDAQPGYIYDEVYHAYTAGQFAQGNADAWVWYTKAPIPNVAYEWTHPPLGKLIIAVGILVFGDNPYGWRVPSAIFGAIGVALMFWLALSIGKRRVALLAVGLLLLDGLYYVQSRIGILDIFGAVFMLGVFVALAAYLAAPPTRVRGPLLWTGFCMGLAIATKWNAVYPAALIGLAAVWRTAALLVARMKARRETMTHARSPQQAQAGAGLKEHLIWVPLGLIAVPLLVYLASFIPFFRAGHTWDELVELHRQMLWYHSHLKATHDFQSGWWQWPLNWRPVWYGILSFGGDLEARTYATGNPLLYWVFLLAVPYAIYVLWRRRDHAVLVILIGFFGQWLPWALVPRIAYMYHFLPAATIGILAVALVVDDFWRRGERKVAWRVVAASYVSLVLLAFLFLYPLYSSWPLTRTEEEPRFWLLCTGAMVNAPAGNPCAMNFNK